jgi:hypothetical protein
MNAKEATPPAKKARRGSHRFPVLLFVVMVSSPVACGPFVAAS